MYFAQYENLDVDYIMAIHYIKSEGQIFSWADAQSALFFDLKL